MRAGSRVAAAGGFFGARGGAQCAIGRSSCSLSRCAAVDTDYFFAQVEERADAALKGRPIGVQQNMEVAAVNYEAREYGLYNRIGVSEAQRLCPELVLIRGDNGVNGMQRYRKASHGVLRVVMQCLDPIMPARLRDSWSGRPLETASFDDIFIKFDRKMAASWNELQGSHCSLLGAASAWVNHVRARVLQLERLTCSAGVASTKLLAMLATKKHKPNGQHCVDVHGETNFFSGVKLHQIKGAGLTGILPDVRSLLLAKLGTDATVHDLQTLPGVSWIAG